MYISVQPYFGCVQNKCSREFLLRQCGMVPGFQVGCSSGADLLVIYYGCDDKMSRKRSK
jgi:hypothetical protein